MWLLVFDSAVSGTLRGGAGGKLPIRGFGRVSEASSSRASDRASAEGSLTKGSDRARGLTAGEDSSSVVILGPVRKARDVVNVLLARHVDGVAILDSIALPVLSEAALDGVNSRTMVSR